MSKYILNIDEVLRDSISSIMISKGLTVSVAESCTGGFISTFFTSGSGASAFFKGSMIVYGNESKIKLLDINPVLIDKHGVVSQAIVEKMADSVKKKYNTNYGLATTGYIELNSSQSIDSNHSLHAWISIASHNNIISKSLIFHKSRIENISDVSHILLNLFRKEIL
tara:strand:- start:2743 stop:3243 length:501 start_codon:yes stop_codon:yes gene_type:complete